MLFIQLKYQSWHLLVQSNDETLEQSVKSAQS